MRPVFAIPTAFLLVSVGVFGYLNPDVVNGWLDDFQPTPVIENESLVSFQENESWLIVVVDFDTKPASPGLDVTQAENLLSGDYGLLEFISQLSGDSVNLSLTFYPDEIRASNPISYYGRDSVDTRDTGESGSDGPSTLASQVVSDLSDEIDWSIFDLDDDGVVDRFLILHTSKPQEDNGGSDRIWSHFGPLLEPIEVGGGLTVEHYTMASLRSTNYRGTIYHEMLHQLGALDLYSVHDQFRTDPWNGVGEWDLMASGNWNGNGAIPGLPMAATIDLLGLERYTETVNWPTVQSCANISINLQPQNSASFRSAHRIELSDGEWLWLEYRDKSGFDSRLPGEGTLVSIQNDNVDGFERNLVNTDSRDAWLKVIEADQDDGLIRGVDDGSSGDTFQVGDTLGNQGVQIRNRFGKLVDWQISIVESLSSGGVQLILSSENCSPSFSSGFLDEKLVVLPGESVQLYLQTEVDCQPIIDLTSSDGRPFSPESQTEVVSAGQEATFTLVWSGVAIQEQKGTIAGNISCGDGPSIDYFVPWFAVGNEPTATEYSSNVPILNPSTISIPIGIEGPVSREYRISIEGALSRIASTSDVATLVEGDELVLEIEPNGLLSNGMIARGEVVLSDTNGNSYSIDITLTGEAIEGSGDILSIIRTPSTMLLIVCSLTALWVLLGIARKESEEGKGGYTEGVPQGGYTNYSPAEQHYSPTMHQIPHNSQSETSRSPVEVQYFDDTPRF